MSGKKKFSQAFWVANFAELLERAAYYGVFIVITLYLSNILGFNDLQAAAIAGTFSALLYFLPTFAGAYADKIGFKKSLMLAFGLLSVGYAGLAIFPTFLEGAGLVEYGETTIFHGLKNANVRYGILPIMALIVIGGSFIKSVITGTVSIETSKKNRAQGFSIFYTIVNIGAFSGKTIVKPLRDAMGDMGYININYFSAGMTLLALIAVWLLFKPSNRQREGKTFGEIWKAFIKVLTNVRLVSLIIIITGFWMVQNQLYATMPKYVIRMAGENAAPSWYANVNPLVVFCTVALITSLMKRRTALLSMIIGMFIMPVSALCMAAGNLFSPDAAMPFGMHPIAFMMVVGIGFQGLAESFISPRFLEYFSLQAPKGEEGLYLGFSHLHSFLSSLLGFIMSGFLLEHYCPDPNKFGGKTTEWLAASSNAHYIWYYFGAIAMISAVALIIYGIAVRKMDANKSNAAAL
ncbi:MAG: MFS transporter [Bacteroidales bacterium]